jgi:hypothetical protein
MKHLRKLKIDSIAKDDQRFDYKVLTGIVIKSSPNTLPLFWAESERWVPVCVQDEIYEGVSEINALTYWEDNTYEEVLWDILKADKLNVFDIAKVITLLEEYSPAYDKELWSRRLKIGVDQWSDISVLRKFELEWISFFLIKNAPLKRVLHFSNPELRSLLRPLLTLNPGINILEAIAGLLSEIAHREKVSREKIWDSLDISEILENLELQSSLKLQNIRKKLYEARYPTIARYRKSMNELLVNIPKSAGIDLHADQDFETPGMRLQADVRSRGDIEKLQNWLEKEKTHLEKIIDIQKGNDKNEPEQ